jgi:FAD dependent oxidoreductase TIGR03364
VSGRVPGSELRLALRARELWEEVGRLVPDVGFRPNGSVTVAMNAAELAVMEAMAAQPDGAARGMKLLAPADVGALNPAIRGAIEGALFCERDAVVEPRAVLPAIRTHLQSRDGYRFLAGRNVVDVDVDGGRLTDHTGESHHADLVVLATGDVYNGIAADHFAGAPLRRCRLQMCQTAPFPVPLTTSIADGDSLRYYPAYRLPALGALAPPPEIVERNHMQLLLVQRANGELTIGDTHAYDEPFDFAVDEDPYAYLVERAESILGRRLPPVQRRWAGVYSQSTDERVVHRARLAPNVTVVTGLGGRGMTLSPAVAEQTFTETGV